MRQQSRQRNSFYSSRFTSNLMLPACLLGTGCKRSLQLYFSTLNRSQEIGQARMPKGDFGGLASLAMIMWRLRF